MLLLKASYEAHLEDRRWLQHYYNQEQTPSVVERYYAQLVKSEVWFTGMLLALSLQLAKWHSVPLEGLVTVCQVHHPENHYHADRARPLFCPVKQPIHLEHSIHCYE